jgi:glycosyltransferase involved in cell wall biosynthesis
LGVREEIPRLLAALDVFLLTSLNEANPVSLLEAMSTGLPVVATRVGSVPEAVRHGVTGYLVEPGDADALAAHCLTLLQNPLAAQEMGAAGRRDVLQRWTLNAMVAGYENLITEIYERKSRRITSRRSEVCGLHTDA